MSTAREEFEAWWLAGEILAVRCEEFDCSTEEAFTIWQASRRAALEDAAKCCESCSGDQDMRAEAIRKLGATKEGQP